LAAPDHCPRRLGTAFRPILRKDMPKAEMLDVGDVLTPGFRGKGVDAASVDHYIR
jgi:hypothetical protein